MPRTKKITPILSVEDLVVRASGISILDGISWTVNRGEHWAILGANGCGKTTLLSTIAAYATATSGRIELFGQAHGEVEWEPLRRQVGIVSAALEKRIPHDELAVETVHSGTMSQLGFWEREAVDWKPALRCMSKMGVRHLSNHPWSYLSQGERQKVFIARSLMAKPKLLVLDEPCAGLDPVGREKFLNSISKIAQSSRGPGVVLVTHHIEEIIPEITHVLVIKQGKTVAAGPKAEVLTDAALSEAFDAKMELTRWKKSDRYSLQVSL
ncbi:MAG: ABC transporter ATP-binding protein [Opitutales bacterium]